MKLLLHILLNKMVLLSGIIAQLLNVCGQFFIPVVFLFLFSGEATNAVVYILVVYTVGFERYDVIVLQSLMQPPESDDCEGALGSEDHLMWLNAMKGEYESLMLNKAWKLYLLPAGRKPIQCKRVSKHILDSDGNIDRYKARLVAKECC